MAINDVSPERQEARKKTYMALLRGYEEEGRQKGPEMGASGVQMMSKGEIWNIEDYNPDLQGQSGMLVWEKMRSSDGHIAGALAHIKTPFYAATWKVFPGEKDDGDTEDSTSKYADSFQARNSLQLKPKKKKKKVDKKAQMHADFVKKWLLEYPIIDGCHRGWYSFIMHTLMCIEFGFSLFEIVLMVTPDGHTVFKKIAPRLPKTVWYFKMREDGSNELESAVQYAWFPDGYKKVSIPSEKLLHFAPQMEGDNYWGRSMCRAAYMHWFHKRELLRFDAIRHERHGVGLPVLTIPDGAGDEANRLAEKILAELRTNERQYVKLPEGFVLEVIYPTGSASDIIGSAKYHDENSGRALLSEFMSLGSNAGSRSLLQGKQDSLMLALQGFGNYLCEVINKRLVKLLIDMNFGPQEVYPRVSVEDLDTMSPMMKAKLMQMLVQADIIRPDDPLEDYARQSLYLPPRDPETSREQIAPEPFGGPNKLKTPGGNNDKPAQGGGNATDRLRDGVSMYERSILPIRTEQMERLAGMITKSRNVVPRAGKDKVAQHMFLEARSMFLAEAKIKLEDLKDVPEELVELRELCDNLAEQAVNRSILTGVTVAVSTQNENPESLEREILSAMLQEENTGKFSEQYADIVEVAQLRGDGFRRRNDSEKQRKSRAA